MRVKGGGDAANEKAGIVRQRQRNAVDFDDACREHGVDREAFFKALCACA